MTISASSSASVCGGRRLIDDLLLGRLRFGAWHLVDVVGIVGRQHRRAGSAAPSRVCRISLSSRSRSSSRLRRRSSERWMAAGDEARRR